MKRTKAVKLLIRGWTLAELMVATAISSLLCAGLVTGSLALQKSFIASRHHIVSQAEQMRLLDYMGLDLRRALTVSTTSDRLEVTIPDYYDSDLEPRDPRIQNGTAVYGSTGKTISYYKTGSIIYRREGTTVTALANDVSDFQLTFLDLGQSIQVSITFVPKYQFSKNNQGSVRSGTATFITTLLRNKRQS